MACRTWLDLNMMVKSGEKCKVCWLFGVFGEPSSVNTAPQTCRSPYVHTHGHNLLPLLQGRNGVMVSSRGADSLHTLPLVRFEREMTFFILLATATPTGGIPAE